MPVNFLKAALNAESEQKAGSKADFRDVDVRLAGITQPASCFFDAIAIHKFKNVKGLNFYARRRALCPASDPFANGLPASSANSEIVTKR